MRNTHKKKPEIITPEFQENHIFSQPQTRKLDQEKRMLDDCLLLFSDLFSELTSLLPQSIHGCKLSGWILQFVGFDLLLYLI
uniref:Putative ovule protein n=1 Tax=Solanum chacoense TaxID=4108 RepID=A0A0V0H3W9_SOLCH